MVENFLDLVIGGPDMSGTTTQIDDIINYFQEQGKIVRDLRGTEIDALFHAEVFFKYNKDYTNLQEFLNNTKKIHKPILLLKIIGQQCNRNDHDAERKHVPILPMQLWHIILRNLKVHSIDACN